MATAASFTSHLGFSLTLQIRSLSLFWACHQRTFEEENGGGKKQTKKNRKRSITALNIV